MSLLLPLLHRSPSSTLVSPSATFSSGRASSTVRARGWRAYTGTGASGTSAGRRTPSGTSRSSRFGRAVSRWPPSTRSSRGAQLPVRARRGGVPADALPLALVALHRGELETARELTKRICRLAELHAARLQAPRDARGRRAVEWKPRKQQSRDFTAAEQTRDSADMAEPTMCWWRAEQIEALLELGRVDDAVDRLDAWEADARRLGRDWVLAHATRCRGLVAAARGDVELSLPCSPKQWPNTRKSATPSAVRALLALGRVRRRARQKRPAREAIEAARAGSTRWAPPAGPSGRAGARTDRRSHA